MRSFCYLPCMQTAYSYMKVINLIAVKANTELEKSSKQY